MGTYSAINTQTHSVVKCWVSAGRSCSCHWSFKGFNHTSSLTFRREIRIWTCRQR